jgi:hypothetical protein
MRLLAFRDTSSGMGWYAGSAGVLPKKIEMLFHPIVEFNIQRTNHQQWHTTNKMDTLPRPR